MNDTWKESDLNFDELAEEVLQNPDARRAALENDLRRKLVQELDDARRRKGLSLRALAKEMGTSTSQVQRMLNQYEGTLTLRTLVKAADALGLTFQVSMTPQKGI